MKLKLGKLDDGLMAYVDVNDKASTLILNRGKVYICSSSLRRSFDVFINADLLWFRIEPIGQTINMSLYGRFKGIKEFKFSKRFSNWAVEIENKIPQGPHEEKQT